MELRLVVLLAACSGGKSHAVTADDAKHVAVPVLPAGDAAAVAPAGEVGDAAIHVAWKNVPVVVRSSPGRTPCNTPRAPAVAPTTTWGVPDAFVIIDPSAPPSGAAVRGQAPAVDGAPAGEARIVLADCALAPRAAAAASLIVASNLDRPAQLVLRERGTPEALIDGTPVAIQLPIAGHAAAVALTAGKVYELAAGDETAWLVAARALVTDATGTATWRDLPVGKHAMTAWLPPRAGQPAKLAHGTVEVLAGALADATIDLAP